MTFKFVMYLFNYSIIQLFTFRKMLSNPERSKDQRSKIKKQKASLDQVEQST